MSQNASRQRVCASCLAGRLEMHGRAPFLRAAGGRSRVRSSRRIHSRRMGRSSCIRRIRYIRFMNAASVRYEAASPLLSSLPPCLCVARGLSDLCTHTPSSPSLPTASGCGYECKNRLVQRGPKYRLEVIRCMERHTLIAKGWGVRSPDFLPKGSFICEYICLLYTSPSPRD